MFSDTSWAWQFDSFCWNWKTLTWLNLDNRITCLLKTKDNKQTWKVTHLASPTEIFIITYLRKIGYLWVNRCHLMLHFKCYMTNFGSTIKDSPNLNTRLVQYLNGQKLTGCPMVQYSDDYDKPSTVLYTSNCLIIVKRSTQSWLVDMCYTKSGFMWTHMASGIRMVTVCGKSIFLIQYIKSLWWSVLRIKKLFNG